MALEGGHQFEDANKNLRINYKMSVSSQQNFFLYNSFPLES